MMKSKNTADRETPSKSDLDSQYGAVGILAVAAALPYQSDAKNSAYARIDAQLDERFVNASA
jgi:hypothetical protein